MTLSRISAYLTNKDKDCKCGMFALIHLKNGKNANLLHNGKEWNLRHGVEADGKDEVDYVEFFRKGQGYIASITDDGDGFWELAEHFYPLFGKPFSAEPQNQVYDETMMQINIFGTFKTFEGAYRNLLRKGNSTLNGRKPKEIYI